MSKKSKKQVSTFPSDVVKVRERIDHWRKTRQKLSPMPDDLWEAAVGLAQSHGVFQMSRELTVSYRSLKNRVGQASDAGRSDDDHSVDFIELSGSALSSSVERDVTILELSNTEGAKLTFRFSSRSDLDLSGVVSAFLQSHE